MNRKNSIRRVLAVVLAVIISVLASAAFAAEKLEIIQSRQQNNQLVLYTLLTDADTQASSAVVTNAEQYEVMAGANGPMYPDSAMPFYESDEGVAYAVILDINSSALEINNLKKMKEYLKALLLNVREQDRILLLATDKKNVEVLTEEFESNLLKVNNAVDAITADNKASATYLLKGIERALTAFSSTSKDFPTRKVILAFTYGADDSGVNSDDIAQKAKASGIPVYFVQMKGTSSLKAEQQMKLDSIARASHGSVIDGRQDLSAAIELFSGYISNASVLTITPTESVWDTLQSDWSVTLVLDERTISNDRDASLNVLLVATASPAPTPTPTPTLTLTPTPPICITFTPEDSNFNTDVPTTTASPSFFQQLLTPPLLYIILSVVVLIIVLLVILLISHKKRRQHFDNYLEEDDSVEPLPPFIPDDSVQSTSLSEDGEETIGLFDNDPEATLSMDQNIFKIDATIVFQEIKTTKALTITKELIFGRGESCNLVLSDQHISRKHCKLTLKPNGIYLQDLGSRSGTLLNEQTVTDETPIKSGDKITLGATEIYLVIHQ